MAYDWSKPLRSESLSREWFDEIDSRFIHGNRLFATGEVPFDRVIPYQKVAGAQVLEIGCGLGLHSELMAAKGARLTAMDITPTAVRATRVRFRLKGIDAEVLLGDAEDLPFPDGAFDFIWSWGVIHHSARTAKIVREIARVLKTDGECRLMVYNRNGMAARVAFIRDHVLRGGFLRQSFDETLWKTSDGFSARFYVREQFEDLLRGSFAEVSSTICGQDADVVPLPSKPRKLVLRVLPAHYQETAQTRRGSFIFAIASRPF